MIETKGGNPQILTDTADTVKVSIYVDGTLTNASSGSALVTVTNAAGGTVIAGGTATNAGTGIYTYALTPTNTADLDVLTATWTATYTTAHTFTTRHEIVGGYLFTVAEARAFDSGDMASTSTYTTEKITTARAKVTDLIEKHTGISWVPRFKREELAGGGTDVLILSRRYISSVQSVTVGGTAVTDYTIDSNNGLLLHNSSTWAKPGTDETYNIVVEYEHGKTTLEDGVEDIALTWASYLLIGTNISDRTMSYTNETGTTQRFSVASAKYPSGIPFVDSWLTTHDERLPV